MPMEVESMLDHTIVRSPLGRVSSDTRPGHESQLSIVKPKQGSPPPAFMFR